MDFIPSNLRVQLALCKGRPFPVLFSLYVNDFEMKFLCNGNVPYDMILFSESTKDLQDMLDTFLLYLCKWGLTVNIAKTKIMVFRNGGFVREEEKWYYESQGLLWLPKIRSQKNRQVPFSGASFESQEPV